MSAYYIYQLVDPITYRIRYVGCSMSPNSRLSQHISFAKRANSRHNTSSWIAGLLEKGLIPNMVILEKFETDFEYESKEVEKQWINHLLKQGAPLLNRLIPKQFRRYSRILPDRERRLRLDKQHNFFWLED